MMSTIFAASLIVFAVYGPPAASPPYIDPVAFVEQQPGCDECSVKFHKPPRAIGMNDKDEESLGFMRRYYRKGARYRVLSGGAGQGFATVDERTDVSCVSLAAKVSLTKSIVAAVAVGSLAVPPRKTAPREPTEAEYEKLYDFAGRVLVLKGVPSSIFDQMESGRVVATDINNDGRTDFIGDFEVVESARKVEHRLFLIAVGDGRGGLIADYIWYFRADQTRDGDTDLLTFIDHEHFGGSPFDQVIVRTRGYEDWGYRILERDRSGNWQVAYEGGGGGC